MATNWTGTIFVFSDEGGNHFVATALPQGQVMPQQQLRTYRASGPQIPMGFPQTLAVDDPDAWLNERKAEGFTFDAT